MALAVAIYGLGLPAFVLQKITQPLYYAREDTKTPFRYALWSMGVNAVVAVGLAPVIGWIAPAIATSLAAWSMVLQLLWGTRRMGTVAKLDDGFYRRIWRIIAASALMGAVLWGAMLFMQPWFQPGWSRVPALALLIGIGMLSYAIAGRAFGAFSPADLRGMTRRKG